MSDVSKHALNIRPIGFGTPRKDKPSPAAMREALSDFDCLWIIANHRLRQTGSYWNGLSAQNIASRVVKAASIGLIACLESRSGRELLAEARRYRGYGLFGMSRYSSSVRPHDMIRRVLYTMLCEDAYLHSASKIVILWPYAIGAERQRERVSLGSHQYDVELITRPKTSKNLDVVIGFAVNVSLARHAERDFRDFCHSLVAGYGWDLRQDDGRSLLLENEGEGMRIWPVTSTAAAQRVLEKKNEYQRGFDLIVSNQSIPAALSAEAKHKEWELVHYTELGRWMRVHYRMDTFTDL